MRIETWVTQDEYGFVADKTYSFPCEDNYSRCSLKATMEAIKWCKEHKHQYGVTLVVDNFVHKGCAYYLHSWIRSNYKTCYYEDDLWRELEPLYAWFQGTLERKG